MKFNITYPHKNLHLPVPIIRTTIECKSSEAATFVCLSLEFKARSTTLGRRSSTKEKGVVKHTEHIIYITTNYTSTLENNYPNVNSITFYIMEKQGSQTS